jgi:hypothetical protein
MKYFIWNWVGVFSLLILPFAGCSGSTNEGGAGSGGAGSGGDAGAGGAAGTGGMAGTGGSEPAPPGLWIGSGQGGADGAFTICFHVREDGNALVRPLNPSAECGASSLEVDFDNDNCDFATNAEIPIVGGSFHLLNEGGGLGVFWDISGIFDGNTASGEAETGSIPNETCSGSWMATPSP